MDVKVLNVHAFLNWEGSWLYRVVPLYGKSWLYKVAPLYGKSWLYKVVPLYGKSWIYKMAPLYGKALFLLCTMFRSFPTVLLVLYSALDL